MGIAPKKGIIQCELFEMLYWQRMYIPPSQIIIVIYEPYIVQKLEGNKHF